MNGKTLEIAQRIEYYLEEGLTDKHDIFSKVVDDCKAPRPMVRRIARDLRQIYQNRITILQREVATIDKI